MPTKTTTIKTTITTATCQIFSKLFEKSHSRVHGKVKQIVSFNFYYSFNCFVAKSCPAIIFRIIKSIDNVTQLALIMALATHFR